MVDRKSSIFTSKDYSRNDLRNVDKSLNDNSFIFQYKPDIVIEKSILPIIKVVDQPIIHSHREVEEKLYISNQ
jgi:hypothetical protein